MKKYIMVIASIALLSACQHQNDTSEDTQQAATQKVEATHTDTVNKHSQALTKETTMTLTGTVEYQNFEGGFFGFIDNKGNKYTPMNLPKNYRKDGLILELNAIEMKDMITTTQFGTLVKVSNIKVIDDTKVKPADNTY